jgi:hypothetical protein
MGHRTRTAERVELGEVPHGPGITGRVGGDALQVIGSVGSRGSVGTGHRTPGSAIPMFDQRAVAASTVARVRGGVIEAANGPDI